MSFLVPIALFGWVPVVLAMFALLPPRRAVITAVLLAWLFLPMAGFPIPGFPDWTKMTATSIGLLIGCLLFDQARLFSFRMRWFDAPMLIWCLTPFFSSVTNGLGVYDGISAVINQVFIWGLPYLIGRIYFSDLDGLRELAIGIVIGGLIYVPLCLIEMKMSPQLHMWVYGYHPHRDFAQTIRFGGYRPTVFMQHGLMVAMWMTAATLCGIWLYKSRTLTDLWGVPMVLLVPILFITTVMCKSMNAVMLLMGGAAALFATSLVKTRLLIIAMLIVGPAYVALRVSDVWGGQQLSNLVARFDAERAASLQTRLNNEAMLTDRAMQRPIFGWGAHGGARVRDESGKPISVTDGLWILAVGNTGLVGLAAWITATILPTILLVRYHRPADWSHPGFAAAGVLAVLIVLYFLDCLMNAMVNPVFTMAAGGLAGLQGLRTDTARQAYARQQAMPDGGARAMPSSSTALAYRMRPTE